MEDCDRYETWKRRRTQTPVPTDFTNRVMDALYRKEQRLDRRLVRMLRGLRLAPAIRLSICSLACAIGLIRVIQVIALFLAEQSSQ